MLGPEDIAVVKGGLVEVHELGVVALLELEVAGVPVAVKSLVVSALADEDRLFGVRRKKIEDGAHGLDMSDRERVIGQDDGGVEEDFFVPDGGEDIVLEGLE